MTDGKELEVIPEGVQLGGLRVDTPHAVVERATGIAKELTKIIKDKSLSRKIGQKEHIYVDAWTTLGGMLGVTPRQIPELSKIHEDGTCEEWVELVRVNDGAIIGRAKGLCSIDEPNWKGKPLYARSSMAATRATGKAFRLAFSWIVVLAGYSPTPAEEVLEGEFEVVKEPPNMPKSSPETPQRTKKDLPTSEAKTAISRPLVPETLKEFILKRAAENKAKDRIGATAGQRGIMVANLTTIFEGKAIDRYSITKWLFGVASSKELTGAQVLALLDWLSIENKDGENVPSTYAIQEARQALTYILKSEGQLSLESEK